MTSRRKFFSIFAAPLAVATVAIASSSSTEPIPDKLTYRGFNLQWTGWKQEQSSIRLSGQWCAKPIDDSMVVEGVFSWPYDGLAATTGGHGGVCMRYECFNLAEKDGREADINTPPERLEYLRQLTLQDLEKLVDEAKLVKL